MKKSMLLCAFFVTPLLQARAVATHNYESDIKTKLKMPITIAGYVSGIQKLYPNRLNKEVAQAAAQKILEQKEFEKKDIEMLIDSMFYRLYWIVDTFNNNRMLSSPLKLSKDNRQIMQTIFKELTDLLNMYGTLEQCIKNMKPRPFYQRLVYRTEKQEMQAINELVNVHVKNVKNIILKKILNASAKENEKEEHFTATQDLLINELEKTASPK